MTHRAEQIIEFAVLSTRPEFRTELARTVAEERSEGVVLREELYECALQTYLFAGFPAALEALRALNSAWPSEQMIPPDEITLRAELLQYDLYLQQGEALYLRVYAANAENVRRELMKLSPELAGWAVMEGYGKTLSRTALDIKTRELAIVAMLTQLGWHRQLYSHILGARNVEATLEDIQQAIYLGAMGDTSKRTHGVELLKRLH